MENLVIIILIVLLMIIVYLSLYWSISLREQYNKTAETIKQWFISLYLTNGGKTLNIYNI